MGTSEVTDAGPTGVDGGWTASSTARRLNYTTRKSSWPPNWFGSLSIWANVDRGGREVVGVAADVDAVIAALSAAVAVSWNKPRSLLE